MTGIKILFLSFFISSCGNNVEIKNNKLENVSPLTEAQMATYQKSGILIKGSPSRLQHQGSLLNVSVYSSKSSLDFIQSVPINSQIPVIFTGGISGNQIVLETIKRQ